MDLVVLRLFLKHVLQLRLGFPGFTDYELLFPAPLGFLAFLWTVDQNRGLKWAYSIKKIGLHVSSLLFFLILSLVLKSQTSPLLVVSWWVGLVLILATGFTLFVNLGQLFKSGAISAIAPSLLMVFSLVIYFIVGGDLFESTILIWSKCLQSVLALLGFESVSVYPFTKMVQVYHPDWAIHIGEGCAGFDSLLFFMGGFCLFAPLYWKLFRTRSWIGFFFLGIAFFTFLNFFRIIFLFSLGLFLMRFLPKAEAISLTLNLFHVHLGYLLYALGLFTYFQVILALKAASFGRLKKLLALEQKPLHPTKPLL